MIVIEHYFGFIIAIFHVRWVLLSRRLGGFRLAYFLSVG